MTDYDRTRIRLASDAWEAVLTAHAKLVTTFAAEGMFDEVSMREYDVLYTLKKAGVPLRLGEVQAGVLLSQPALSRLVDRMVARGLLARCGDEEDRRAVRISLTEEGAALQKRIGKAHAASIARELYAALTSEETEQLQTIAAKLGGNDEQTDRSTRRSK